MTAAAAAEYATAKARADMCAVVYAALAAYADEYAADADRATVAAFAAATRSDVYAADYTAAAAAATAGAAAAAAKAVNAWSAYIAAAAAARPDPCGRRDRVLMNEQERRQMQADTAWMIQRERINTYMELERQGETAQAAQVEATIGESNDDLRRIVGPASMAYIAAVSTVISTELAAQVAYRLALAIASPDDLVKSETWNQDDKRNGVT